MALNLRLLPKQGILLDTGYEHIWVYVSRHEDGHSVILSLDAPQNVAIVREAVLMKEGKDPGPQFCPEAYQEAQIKV